MDKTELTQLILDAKLAQAIAVIQEQLEQGSATQKEVFLIQQGVNMLRREKMLGVITSKDFQERTKELSSELMDILEKI